MGVIYFNGVSSKSIGLEVENPPAYKTPEREYESYHVPGRNGDLLLDLGSYKNVTRSYDVSFGSHNKTHAEMASAVSAWLYSPIGEYSSPVYPSRGSGGMSTDIGYNGYFRLEDSYEPEYYRLARCVNETEFQNTLNHIGRATIEFDCMPQRFLKSGENVITSTENSISVYNPTMFVAKPLIKVMVTFDDGLLTDPYIQISPQDKLGNNLILTIHSPFSGTFLVEIDSELEETGGVPTVNWNSWKEHTFPIFNPGKTDIYLSRGITSIQIIPRWWTV